MKFTAQEEYGLRCLLQIAREPAGFATIHEVAGRVALTPAYVAKLMRALRKAELVTSIRGQKGGYRLARPPADISVGAVLASLGGRLYSKDFCLRHAGNSSVCIHNGDCSIRPLWIELDAIVHEALSATTLKDLLSPERTMHSRLQSHHASAAASAPVALARRNV